MKKSMVLSILFITLTISNPRADAGTKKIDASATFQSESALPPQDPAARKVIPSGNIMTPDTPIKKGSVADVEASAAKRSSNLTGLSRYKKGKAGEGRKK
jgi:hypothetical protein